MIDLINYIFSLNLGVDLLRLGAQLPGVKFSPSAGPSGITVDFGIVTASEYDPPSSFVNGLQLTKDATDFGHAFAYEVSKHKWYERELAGLSSKVAF